MPQLIALAVAGAGLYAGYKWVSRKVAEMTETERLRAAEVKAAREPGTREMGNLVLDPSTGEYRPDDRHA
jgi:hypothetical protein